MVPPATSTAASSLNLLFIVYSLLPCYKAHRQPIANLYETGRYRPIALYGDGGVAPTWWYRTKSRDHDILIAKCAGYRLQSFDPKVLQCKAADGPDCLTAPQVEA